MRDKVDIITGDFNQGAYILGEVMTQVVAFYQAEHNTTVNWSMPKPYEEIRTIIINWPAFSDASLSGPRENLSILVKPLTTFEDYNVEDFGLCGSDKDAHTPSFYIIRKSRIISHADLHQRSEAGKKCDADHRKEKKKRKEACPLLLILVHPPAHGADDYNHRCASVIHQLAVVVVHPLHAMATDVWLRTYFGGPGMSSGPTNSRYHPVTLLNVLHSTSLFGHIKFPTFVRPFT